MSYGQISYPSGASSPTILTFVYPPVSVPVFDIVAVRHDNDAAGGARESITESLVYMFAIQMEWVVAGADATQWSTFFTSCGLPGLYFDYSDSYGNTSTCRLDEDAQEIPYKHAGTYTAKATFRQKV